MYIVIIYLFLTNEQSQFVNYYALLMTHYYFSRNQKYFILSGSGIKLILEL